MATDAADDIESNKSGWKAMRDERKAAGSTDFFGTVETAVAVAKSTPAGSATVPSASKGPVSSGEAAANGQASSAPPAANSEPPKGAPRAASKPAAPAAPPAPAPPAIPAVLLKPAPSKKSYMPTHMAPEAYGKKPDPKRAQMAKDVQEYMVKWTAKKEREKARAKKKPGGDDQGSGAQDTGDDGAGWQLFFLIAFGIFTALAEALDLDVLIGIMLMPFMSGMQYLAVKFDNVNLDPNVWIAFVGDAYNDMCKNNPANFVFVDLSFFVVLVNLILFQADISKWWRERNLRAQGYDSLQEEEQPGLSDDSLEKLFMDIDENGSGDISREEMQEAITKVFGEVEEKIINDMMTATDTDGDGEISLEEFKQIMRAGPEKLGALSKVVEGMTDADTMQLNLRNAREDLEEVDLNLRLRGESIEPQMKAKFMTQRTALTEKISTLEGFLSAVETDAVEAVDLEAANKAAEEAEAAKKREGSCGEYTKMAVTILKNTISGVLTIYLYFMDLISDYQVTELYYNAGAYKFAALSAGLLIGQFMVVWMRVLPYLHVTYGPESIFYRIFLWVGMPLGCFFFDFLMFLGPFGLLPILPMPEAMRLFIPAYGATRMIAEVLIEAFPQWMMQAAIFVMVSEHVRDGTASDVDKTLFYLNDGSFVSLMPKSILLSSLTMLKTWFDLVQEAREAGVSVAQKGVQLWNVGAGLPLDAIKSGSITSWGCSYEISDQEVVSLVDALGKNASLERLDLSKAGFEWMPPIQREERSALSTLLEVMNADEAALESLEKLVISRKTGWEIPVATLRSGPEKALKALLDVPFLSKGGPEREEMHTMFELLCKNRSPDPGEPEIDLSYTAVSKVFTESRKDTSNKKLKRATWQTSTAQLISKGMTRRSHFKLIVGAEVLHNVGFGVQELLDLGFSDTELKEGFFEARELYEANFKPKRLQELGYTPKEMWEAEIPASDMKQLNYTARQLHDGGYTAQQMKDSRAYTLVELKEGRYKAVELGDAGYLIPDLRAAKFTALDLRKAMVFTVQMMRDAGYTCQEMKKAGYDAKRINDAGYSAKEADGAGYTVVQMFSAGFKAGGLRDCGHTALVLREAGYELGALLGANYNAEELVDAGYTVKEIKEAGTSLVQLKAAGTPMATYMLCLASNPGQRGAATK